MKKMFLLGILIFAFLMAPWSDATAQAPKVINYQAQLVDATTDKPLEGTYTITFALFTAQTGGAAVWSDIKDVQVEKGYLNVYLGDKNPFGDLPFDRAYYLEITVGNGNPYPRTLLSSTPYTMFAVTADTALHSLTSDLAFDVKDGVITFAKLHPSLQIAGGDLEGFFPNPTIKSSALLGLIKPGSITQSMLGPNVTAIPMGPAGGALIGNYPNPWLGDRVVRNENIDLGTITLDRFNVNNALPGQIPIINANGNLVWATNPAFSGSLTVNDITAQTGDIHTLTVNDLTAVNITGENGAFNALAVTNDANFGANIIVSGDVSAANFIGNGAGLTNLDATALTTGIIDPARLSGTYDIDITGNAETANSLNFPFESGPIDAGAWLMSLDNSADASVGSESGVMNLVNSNAANTSPVLRLSHANADGTALLIDGGRIVSNNGFDITANSVSAGGSYLLNLQQNGTGPGVSLQTFNADNSDVLLYIENASSTTGRSARIYNSDENNTGYALSVENAGSGQGLWVLGGSTAVSVGDVEAVAGGETDLTAMNRYTVIHITSVGGATTINAANLPNTETVVDGTLLYLVNDSGSDITSDLGNITSGTVATFVRVAGEWRKIN